MPILNYWTTPTARILQVARLMNTKSDNEMAPIFSTILSSQHLSFALQLSENTHGQTLSLDSMQSGVNYPIRICQNVGWTVCRGHWKLTIRLKMKMTECINTS